MEYHPKLSATIFPSTPQGTFHCLLNSGKHTTVSPLYSQANGLVKKEVQIVKNLLTKAKKDRRDPYLGLLEYRNTPIDDVGSPAQLLMSRRLRSIIPTTNAQLQPNVLDPHKVMEKLRLKQEQQKHYLDQHAKHLHTLAI